MTTVGVIGGGQLGQMLGFAGRELGVEVVFLEPAADPPAKVVGEVIGQAFDSEEGLAMLARKSDVVTFEFENVPVGAVEWLGGRVPVFPGARALRHSQDRLAEKRLFGSLGIPVPGYRAVDSERDLVDAARELGLPLVLKTRRFGYDGKGQMVVRAAGDVAGAWRQLGGSALIAEQMVAFDREISVIGARGKDGGTAIFPLIENQHREGILRVSKAPVDDPVLRQTANGYLEHLLERLEYVGVLALELFAVGDRLLANEYAPRVHNSGHWTIEGARTSQFGNHLRAILGRPLGGTEALGHAGMINLIGDVPDDTTALKSSGFQIHDYGKIARTGRKVGHITTVAESAAGRDRRLAEALKILKI